MVPPWSILKLDSPPSLFILLQNYHLFRFKAQLSHLFILRISMFIISFNVFIFITFHSINLISKTYIILCRILIHFKWFTQCIILSSTIKSNLFITLSSHNSINFLLATRTQVLSLHIWLVHAFLNATSILHKL